MIIIIAVALLCAIVLLIIPHLETRRLNISNSQVRTRLTNELRKTWAQVLLGAVAVSGIIVGWKEMDVSRTNLEQSIVESRQQIQLMESGQITDRFASSIELLGKENLSQRIGALYALERIARDSVDDAPVVMQLLCVYVREHTPQWPPSAELRMREESSCAMTVHRRVCADIQAALTVLGRWKWEEMSVNIDLRATDLPAVDLSKANLFGANLFGAFLPGAILSDTNLEMANLEQSTLWFAHLDNANLVGADLSSAHLENAYLPRADLTSADLSDVHIPCGFLSRVNLRDAVLTGADLTNANLQGANLDNAVLQEAVLQNADMSNIQNWKDIRNLHSACIHGATLPPSFRKWALEVMGATDTACRQSRRQ